LDELNRLVQNSDDGWLALAPERCHGKLERHKHRLIASVASLDVLNTTGGVWKNTTVTEISTLSTANSVIFRNTLL